MNRFNQILINAAPPSDDHGSKYIYIYISYSPWTGTSFDNSITVCIYIYIYLLHPIFLVFIEFRSRFRIEFTEPPYRATLFFLPLFILSESLNPSSSLAFEVSSEKNRSLFPRCSKGTRIYPITFQIRYNFEEREGGERSTKSRMEVRRNPPSKCIYRKHVLDGARYVTQVTRNRGFSPPVEERRPDERAR